MGFTNNSSFWYIWRTQNMHKYETKIMHTPTA